MMIDSGGSRGRPQSSVVSLPLIRLRVFAPVMGAFLFREQLPRRTLTMSVKKTKSNLPGAGPGRPKGSQNKNNALIRDMIGEALHQVGGVEYLAARANDPKTASAFLSLVGKVLPIQVTGEDGGAIQTVTRIELVALK